MLYAFCWHWLFSLSTIFLQSVDSFFFLWPSVLVDLHHLFNSSLPREVQVPSSVVTVMNYNTQKNEHLFFSYLSLLSFCFVLRLKSPCSLALLSRSSYLILSGAGTVGLFNHAYFPHLLINFGSYFISSNYLGSVLEYFHNKHIIKILYIYTYFLQLFMMFLLNMKKQFFGIFFLTVLGVSLSQPYSFLFPSDVFLIDRTNYGLTYYAVVSLQTTWVL